MYLEYQEYLVFLVDLSFRDNRNKMVEKDMLVDLVFDKKAGLVYLEFLVDLVILECLVDLDFLDMKNLV